jgi:hypothetical protein
VNGSHIISARQVFAIAWQMDTVNHFEWTFPTTSDQVIANRTNVLRWQTNITGTATIEYSTNGINWTTISNAVDLAKKYFQWVAPDSFATALLRIIPASAAAIVSDSFVISKATSVFTGFNCVDSFLLHWNKLNVSRYELYQLGVKYMEPFASTPDTFIILKKNQHPSLYYAVAPVVNNKPGLRSFTVKYDAQGVECYFRNFYIQLQTNDRVTFSAGIGSLFNVAQISFQRLAASGYKNLSVINAPSSLSFSFSDSGLLRGVNYYRLQIRLSNNTFFYSEVVPVYYFPDLPVIIYPNPLARTNSLHILSQQAVRYSIHVYDVNGRMVMNRNLKDAVNNIPGYSFSTGTYFIIISNETGRIATQKLVVY